MVMIRTEDQQVLFVTIFIFNDREDENNTVLCGSGSFKKIAERRDIKTFMLYEGKGGLLK